MVPIDGGGLSVDGARTSFNLCGASVNGLTGIDLCPGNTIDRIGLCGAMKSGRGSLETLGWGAMRWSTLFEVLRCFTGDSKKVVHKERRLLDGV